jgi:serine phosphatase RsbU (regulator of sigma subunit)
MDFGRDRLGSAVCRASCSAKDTVRSINETLQRFVGGAVRKDDQTLLVLRAKEPG